MVHSVFTSDVDDSDLLKAFELNVTESRSYELFCIEHCGTVELIFTPTEIGVKIELLCKGCGKRLDITDYDCW